MYDSVDFKINSNEVKGIDFLSEIPCCFDITCEQQYRDGKTTITGTLGNYKISVSDECVKIGKGSLCKYYLGDNFQTMTIEDTRMAIEKLSDALHLPFEQAQVTRIDVAQNFILKHPPEVYWNHLGISGRSKRLEQPDGLYYRNTRGSLVFYDKIKEQKKKGQTIPELYRDKNVLRYEARYTTRLNNTFKVNRVTGSLLYDEDFYSGLMNRWEDSYKAINKINDVTMNINDMKIKSAKDLKTFGVLQYVKLKGGELAAMKSIDENLKKGELTRRQAFDLREYIKEVCKQRIGISTESDVIKELNNKVEETCKNYRQ
jgi:hypothetical protein